MEDKRGTNRSCSSAIGSLSSSSEASTPPPSPSESLLPLVSPPNVSSHRPPSPVREHGRSSKGILMVDLSSSEEDDLPDTSCDEEFSRKLFGDLNRGLLGPPSDGNVIILNDSNEDEEVREEDTADAEAAVPSAVNSPTPTVSTTEVDDTSAGKQDDNSDGGDETGSPYATAITSMTQQHYRQYDSTSTSHRG
jgi:hypothetical protein